MRVARIETKEKFIIAAAREIQQHGTVDFSIRRVAEACGVSCGAPYKHFRNKNELILEVIRFYNAKWNEILSGIVCEAAPTREIITDVSIAYIRFLSSNPEFQSIVMLNDSSMTKEQIAEKSHISILSSSLIRKYCDEVSMPPDTEKRKLFTVRSLIYGASVMLNSGELESCEETYNMIRNCISREFDIY